MTTPTHASTAAMPASSSGPCGSAFLHATTTCSSVYVRSCLRGGDVRAAAAALGRPHRVDCNLAGGEVTTAVGTALPAPGRYAGQLDARPVELEVAAAGQLLTRITGPTSTSSRAVRRVSVEFLERIETS